MLKTGWIKRVASAGILLAGILFLCFLARDRDSALEKGGQKLTGEPNEQETMQSDTPFSLADILAQIDAQEDAQILLADLDTQCEIWESRNGEEKALPVEIFKDLQRYVAQGECAEALLAYHQEELLCTVEEAAEVCPDFQSLVDEYLKTEHGENLLDTNRIYCLEETDGKSCFLMFYHHSDGMPGDDDFIYSMRLREGEEGWQIRGSAGGVGGVDGYEIFTRQEEGQRVYYLLRGRDREDFPAWLELSRLSEDFYVPIGGWTVMPVQTGVESEIFFQEAESDLTAQISAYVEENKCFLAWMQRNDMPIWGDEEEQTHIKMRELLDPPEGDSGLTQIWRIDFDGREVTFQMVEAEDGTLALAAYAHEGDNDGALLLLCRLCFTWEAGVVRCTPAYWEAFDFNGLTMRNTENAWLLDEVQERAWEEQQQRSIAPWEGETSLPEELFQLLREEALAGLYGKENALLEAYRLDITEDMESFMHRVAETDWGKGFGRYPKDGECKWVYRWFGEDGDENYLSCINYDFFPDSIQWWKLAEGELEQYAYIEDLREPSQLICFEGQVYYLTEAVPEYRGGHVSTAIVEIGNSNNWRSSYFYITESISHIQDSLCISLYEEEGLPLEVKEYVQQRFEDIQKARGVGGWTSLSSAFYDTEKEGKLAAEESRILNSLSNGSVNRYANHHYFAADIDNDGVVEYGHADLGSNWRVTFYEKGNGGFRAIPFEKVISDQSGITESKMETVGLWQFWCEKLGDTTYLFTVEGLAYSPDYILRIRVLREDYMEDKAIYLLKENMEEYCGDWDIEIRPSAEGVG